MPAHPGPVIGRPECKLVAISEDNAIDAFFTSINPIGRTFIFEQEGVAILFFSLQ